MGWFSGYNHYTEKFLYSLTPSYLWKEEENALAMSIQLYLQGKTTLTDIAKSGIATPSLKMKSMINYMYTPEYLFSVSKLPTESDNPDNLKENEQYDESFVGPLPEGYSNVAEYRKAKLKKDNAFSTLIYNKFQNQLNFFSKANPNIFISYKLRQVTVRDIPNNTPYIFTSFYGKSVIIKHRFYYTPKMGSTGSPEYYDISYSGSITVDGKTTTFSESYTNIKPENLDSFISTLGPSITRVVPVFNSTSYAFNACSDIESIKNHLNMSPTMTKISGELASSLESMFFSDMSRILFFEDELDRARNDIATETESDFDTWKSNIKNAPIIPVLPIQSLEAKGDFLESSKKIYIKACNKGFGRKSWENMYKQNQEVERDFSHNLDVYFGHIQLGFYHNDILVPELAQYAFEFAKRMYMNSNVIGKPETVTEEVPIPGGNTGTSYKTVIKIAPTYTEIKNQYGNFVGYPDIYEVIAYASVEYNVYYCANFPVNYAAYQQEYLYGDKDDDTLTCIWYIHKLSNSLIEVIKVYGLNSYVSSIHSINNELHTTPTHYASLGRTFTEESSFTNININGMYLPYIPEIVQKLPYKVEKFCLSKSVVSVNFVYMVIIEHVKWYNTGFGEFALTAVKIVISVVAIYTAQWYVAAAVVATAAISILEQFGVQSGLLSKIKLAASIFAVVFSAGSAIENVWNSASSSTATMSNVSTTATASNSVGTFANEANFAGSFNLSGINTANGFQYTNIAGSTIGTSSSMSLMDMAKLGSEVIKPFQKGYELYSEHKQRSVMKTIEGIYNDMTEMNKEYALKTNEITYNLHNMNVTQEKNKLYVKYLKTCFNSPYHFDECMYTGLDIDIMYDNTIRTELDNKYEIENSLLFA